MTNLNITSNDKVFMYVVDYIRNTDINTHEFEYIQLNDATIFKTQLLRHENEWSELNNESYNWLKTKEIRGLSTLRLYFPQFSVETYDERIKYVLDVTMYISNKKIILGSFVIDRFDCLAAPNVLKFQGQEYYECIDLDIIDPYDILYADEFEDFRKLVKNDSDKDMNSDATSLYISLHPVSYNNTYIMDNNYNGSQNSIIISEKLNDFLNYRIKFCDDKNVLIGELNFNSSYTDIKEYLSDTYNIEIKDSFEIEYILTLDKLTHSIIKKSSQSNICEFGLEQIYNDMECLVETADGYKKDKIFSDWKYWEEGINIISTIVINIDGEEKFRLHSNPIPLNQNIYSKIKINDYNQININDMTIQNINVINKITLENQQYHSPENSKSNIILPVFYKVRELGHVIIHPEVNENICLNLDAYKSKVDTFVIQIEGIKFVEIGTTGAGTIFKIIGSSLPQENKSGTFYILSQDGDLVTSGKYKYEY